MKREILFKAKRLDNNEWVYGCFGYNTEYKASIIIYVKDNHRCTHVVHKETIGQFTGLTDKNGVKIFEGDMLQFPFDLGQAYIVYDGIRFAVKTEGSEAIDYESSETLQHCEIIGNIHDA